jgi:hypothetical protein
LIETLKSYNTFGVRFICDSCSENHFITNVFTDEQEAMIAIESIKMIHDLDCEGIK